MRIIGVFILCVLSFSLYGQKGTVKVEKKEDFIPRIAGRAGGDISKFYLCDSEGITIGYDSKIVSFSVYALDPNNQQLEIDIKGNRLSDEACKKVMALPPGSTVYFQEIMVESKGRIVKVNSMMFFLKDEN